MRFRFLCATRYCNTAWVMYTPDSERVKTGAWAKLMLQVPTFRFSCSNAGFYIIRYIEFVLVYVLVYVVCVV